MDIATLIGLLGGIAIVGAAMAVGSDVLLFVSIPSLMVVLGGTAAASLIKFPLSHNVRAIRVAINAFRFEAARPRALIRTAYDIADIARKKGLLALEDYEVDDPFLQKGIRLLVDGHPAEFVRGVLVQDMEHSLERHELGQRIFRGIGEAAPAFGMIGTLVGLVQMLNVLDDPSSIGPAMAVALLTTLYGALIANLIAIPIADKLEFRAQQESFNQALIVEIVTGIKQGQNPRVLEELLETFLPHHQRFSAVASPARGEAQESSEEAQAE